MSSKLRKPVLGLIVVFTFAAVAYASYADFYVASNGHVGIGTDQPITPLHIAYDNVNVGTGPNAQVLIGGFTTQTEGLAIGWNSSDKYAWMQSGNYGDNPYRPLDLQPQSGNVGINRSDPGSRLTVSSGDVEVDTYSKGVVLHAPDGHCARLTLANDNSLNVSTITCP